MMATATLTWQPVTTNIDGSPTTDVNGYEVHRGVGTSTPSLLATLGKVTTYIDSTVPNVTQNVSYEVLAFDLAGNRGPMSSIVTKAVDVTPPAAPTGLVVVVT